MEKKQLFDQLKKLSTEQRNPNSMDIDARSIPEILSIINDEDKKVALAVETQIPYITQAVELVVRGFVKGGRLIYVGAGTSGRVGVVDASECPPTFGVPFEMVQGMIAGGEGAMFRAVEGAEDKPEGGTHDIDKKEVGKNDIVCGIAASMRTPYVIGAIQRAKELGAKAIYVTTNPRTNLELPEFKHLAESLDVAICAEVGPEVIMGSTRMKSGTAQKLILNMITTTAMIRLGKIYENMMIDLQMTNKKLVERAKRVVMTITNVSYEEAEKYLVEAKGHVKTAIVMIKANANYEEATLRLKDANGFVRAAIEGNKYSLI
ncbi:MAG: N-acetylmuramic acid 6-phosphate etherase [Ignavibacteriales bacterium]|nr:N-acetylmuramic acid 6-phosphate etherase [Ignavibacteriales bacterium]